MTDDEPECTHWQSRNSSFIPMCGKETPYIEHLYWGLSAVPTCKECLYQLPVTRHEPSGNTGLLTTTAQISARRGDTLADAKRNGWTDSADHVPNAGQMVNSATDEPTYDIVINGQPTGITIKAGGEQVTAGITAEQVKTLRDKTGHPVMRCKDALQRTSGDQAEAESHLVSIYGDGTFAGSQERHKQVTASNKMRADLARPIPPPVHYVPGPVRIKTFPDSVVRHNLIDLDNHRLSWNRILHKRWNEAHTGWVLQWLPILSQAQYVDFMDTCAMKGTQDWPVKWLHTVMIRIMNGKEFRHAGSDRNSGRSTDRNSGRGQ